MIVIDSCSNVDLELYDEVWYPTYSCPNMRVGCKHKPELGPSKSSMNYFYKTSDLSGFYELYAKELMSKKDVLSSATEYAKDKWIQMVCYEKNPLESDIFILYEALLKCTKDIKIMERK